MTTIPKDMMQPGHPWYRMEAADDDRSAEIHIYGAIRPIAWWEDDVAAGDLVRELADLDVDRITLRINSPGGSVYDGIAIMNALARHKAHVTATIDGLAASAATLVMLSADEIHIGQGAEVMIHDASSIVWGQASHMRKEADSLDRISQTAAELYAKRAGGTAEEWRDAMLAETWYSADEALAAGLVDKVLDLPAQRVEDEEERTDAVSGERAARAFGWRHPGRAASAAPYIPGAAPRSRVNADDLARLGRVAGAAPEAPASPAANTNPNMKGGPTMSDAITQGLRERLGLPAEADDATMLATLDERLNTNPPIATLEVTEGVVMIDEEQLQQLRDDAAAGREARDNQRRAAREAAVEAAVKDGRIAPSRRDHWVKALEADEGAVEVLNSLAKGTVPLEAKGFTGGVDESADEDRDLYSKFWPEATQKSEEA